MSGKKRTRKMGPLIDRCGLFDTIQNELND